MCEWPAREELEPTVNNVHQNEKFKTIQYMIHDCKCLAIIGTQVLPNTYMYTKDLKDTCRMYTSVSQSTLCMEMLEWSKFGASC